MWAAALLSATGAWSAPRPERLREWCWAGGVGQGRPWAVLFGGLSWVPNMAMQLGIVSLSLLSIRYVAGSWLRSGLFFLCPVSAMVLLAGIVEFLVTAAIVLAARGRAGPLAFVALAMIAPAFAVPPSG